MQIVEKQTPKDLHLIKSKASHFRSIITMYRRSLSHQNQADLSRRLAPLSRKIYHSPEILRCVKKEIYQNHPEWKVVSQYELSKTFFKILRSLVFIFDITKL